MPATIRRIPIADIEHAPNSDALLGEYARESSIDGMPEPRANWPMYEAIEATGAAHTLGAFVGNELVGFCILLVTENPHYSARIGVTESLFVAAEHRPDGAGLQLLRAAETLAAELGAVGLLVSAPRGGRLADVLAARGCYAETNRVFFRSLA